jgi:hypothetical protein
MTTIRVYGTLLGILSVCTHGCSGGAPPTDDSSSEPTRQVSQALTATCSSYGWPAPGGDATAALQACLTGVGAGGTALLPAGVYYISQPLREQYRRGYSGAVLPEVYDRI